MVTDPEPRIHNPAPQTPDPMPRTTIIQRIVGQGAVAVVRADNPSTLKHIVDALLEAGMSAIEVTMTVPRALDIIEETARTMGDQITLGVGSVLDPETARMAIIAGRSSSRRSAA